MADPTYNPGSNPFSAGDDFPSTDASATLPAGVSGVHPDYTYKVGAKHETLVTTSWNGKEKRSSKAPIRRRFIIQWEQITPGDADTLWNHYLAQEGTLQSFTYYDYLSGEPFTVRYASDEMNRETIMYDAEKAGIELLEVL